MEHRNTIQRDLILNAVRQSKDHATAEEIYERIAEAYPSIGKGTVYRNLGILAEEGAILKLEVPGGPDHYDGTLMKHHHVLCKRCRRIFDVDMQEIDVQSHIQDMHGAEFLGYVLLLHGLCPKCREQ